MPFESAGELDNFNRANVNPLNGSWSNRIITDHEAMQIASNLAAANTPIGGIDSSAWWTGGIFQRDQEVYYTVQALQANNGNFRVYARLTNPGTATCCGYMYQYRILSGTDDFGLFRIDNASFTNLSVGGSSSLSAGTKLGFRLTGDNIQLWRLGSTPGSAWTLMAAGTDSTYMTPGYVGMGSLGITGNNIGRIDDFHAGSIVLPDVGEYVTKIGGRGAF